MILETMLQRLYASLVHGPCMNCRPHGSRQRIDLTHLSRFNSVAPHQLLQRLLEGSAVSIQAAVKPFMPVLDRPLSADEFQKKSAWEDQQRLVSKLLGIIEDSVDYEQETGENALNIGFPLLCVPALQEDGFDFGTKIIAPIAFLPVELSLRRGAVQGLTIKPKGEGTDFLIPNPALLAWLEQQTRQDTSELFADPEGLEPFREINELMAFLLKALELPIPASEFVPGAPLTPAPRAEEIKNPFISHSAILGLFPVSNQNLLRDTKAMMEEPKLSGPVVQFLKADALVIESDLEEPAVTATRSKRVFAEEHLTTVADPCQSRAVKLARACPNLVIHGPPGTGKSQTITNIISDHLAKGERVLFVCEKRTALDVVKNRLDHLGLGHLCAVVHDPQRDQRDLYMGIRDQLENLAEAKRHPDVGEKLSRLNTELQALHDNLLATYQALLGHEKGASFHELVGEWESIQVTMPAEAQDMRFENLKLHEVQQTAPSLNETLARAQKIRYPSNPWPGAVGIALPIYLSEPFSTFESRLRQIENAAIQADAAIGSDLPGLSSAPLAVQQAEYLELQAKVGELGAASTPEQRAVWARASIEKLKAARDEISGFSGYQSLLGEKLEPELRLIAENKSIENVNAAIATLKDYESISPRWFTLFPTAKVKAAKVLLGGYGLQTTPGDIAKLQDFLNRFKARLILSSFYSQQVDPGNKGAAPDDKLKTLFEAHQHVIDFLLWVSSLKHIAGEIKTRLITRMEAGEDLTPVQQDCGRLAARCASLERLENDLQRSGLFRSEWFDATSSTLRNGAAFAPKAAELLAQIDTIEDSIRLRDSLAEMPQDLQTPATEILRLSVPPETGIAFLRKLALANEISQRIKTDAQLQSVDAERLDNAFRQYAEKEAVKRELTRANILFQWQQKQITRLLAATGTQLNTSGARLKQRLFLRGEKALKLRQMISHGRDMEGGDPLFEVCPVWMASPATVAQIFPREAIFDVLIFDEASQCKLEEALPVLLRGKRVVIAGDPKQLPPTRFFESGIKESEEEEAETEQELFDRQQRSVEDLLTAALNLDVQQAYLDVHYRSKNPDLIGFSNQHFYGSRLQPVPGHPVKETGLPPIKLHRVNGVYSKRANRVEAEEVLRIVRELLKLPKPPSIGIACFNLPQRDMILEVLDEAVGEDQDFAEKLEIARSRKGEGSFEGLFVKNLENVQGDERDVMIISTTFAPDENGNFRRGFGPVGTALGGRRLNVLVTRARTSIHLITSIPRHEYQSLMEVKEGTPTGRWYLYAYLKYAESLQESYRAGNDQVANPDPASGNLRAASLLAEAVARKCNSHYGLTVDAAWGNAGFQVDVAVKNAEGAKHAPLGVFCDMNRFEKAPDPVEWESFRTAVLERAGWTFHRLWSPAYFRNPEAQFRTLLQKHERLTGGSSSAKKSSLPRKF